MSDNPYHSMVGPDAPVPTALDALAQAAQALGEAELECQFLAFSVRRLREQIGEDSHTTLRADHARRVGALARRVCDLVEQVGDARSPLVGVAADIARPF